MAAWPRATACGEGEGERIEKKRLVYGENRINWNEKSKKSECSDENIKERQSERKREVHIYCCFLMLPQIPS
jgi:hypothetical protein